MHRLKHRLFSALAFLCRPVLALALVFLFAAKVTPADAACRITNPANGLWIVQPAPLSDWQISAMYNFLRTRVDQIDPVSGRMVILINYDYEAGDDVGCTMPRVLDGLQYTMVFQWFTYDDQTNFGNLLGDMALGFGARLDANGGVNESSADYWRTLGYMAYAGQCPLENADCRVLQKAIARW